MTSDTRSVLKQASETLTTTGIAVSLVEPGTGASLGVAGKLLGVFAALGSADYEKLDRAIRDEQLAELLSEKVTNRLEKNLGLLAARGVKPGVAEFVSVFSEFSRVWVNSDHKKKKYVRNAFVNSFKPELFEDGLYKLFFRLLDQLTYAELAFLRLQDESVVQVLASLRDPKAVESSDNGKPCGYTFDSERWWVWHWKHSFAAETFLDVLQEMPIDLESTPQRVRRYVTEMTRLFSDPLHPNLLRPLLERDLVKRDVGKPNTLFVPPGDSIVYEGYCVTELGRALIRFGQEIELEGDLDAAEAELVPQSHPPESQ